MLNPKPLFQNPEAHPLILYLVCEQHLEADWKTWISETIVSELKRLFGIEIPELNLNKLQAAKTLHVSDTFWDEWEIFKNITLALNGLPLSTQTIHAPNTAQLMNAVEMANIVRKQAYDPEVARFAAACLLYDDVHYAPEPLDFCQVYLSQPMYECKDCGKKASALPPFKGFCESCSKIYDNPKAFNFKPKEDKGSNTTFFLTYDPMPIKKRYEELLKEKNPYINEVPEDIQCAKLLIAHDYSILKVDEFHKQLKEYR